MMKLADYTFCDILSYCLILSLALFVIVILGVDIVQAIIDKNSGSYFGEATCVFCGSKFHYIAVERNHDDLCPYCRKILQDEVYSLENDKLLVSELKLKLKDKLRGEG